MKKEKSNRFASNIDNKGRLIRAAGAIVIGTTAILLWSSVHHGRSLPGSCVRILGLRGRARLVRSSRLRGEDKILSRSPASLTS